MERNESAFVTHEQRLGWWREAKFGMFIHWGLYSSLAGEWKGRAVPGIGEWIMSRARIPIAEYEPLAAEFNPTAFDARQWVKIAKDAGMKYIVITAKHHDGFCMYHSKVSKYNIVDATPYGRDPMKDLADACAEAGIKLCFYYSQTQDWYDKDAVGNNWDFPDEASKDFQGYLDRKVKPQLKELLTQYGLVGLIWFDTPLSMNAAQSKELADYVHELQPECIVSGRIGNELGDYICLRDNETPAITLNADWETCATLNNTWGFKKDDQAWKDPDLIIRLLCDIIGKGGTYLLNVGPTAEGIIPEPSVHVLKEVGRYLNANGEAVYGTTGNPFDTEFKWGTITQKPGKLYLHFLEWPQGPSLLFGLKNKVLDACLLQKPDQPLAFQQEYDPHRDHHSLLIELPERPMDSAVPVVVLNIEGTVLVEPALIQQGEHLIYLETHRAELHKSENSPLSVTRSGNTVNWSNPEDWLSWTFKVTAPGDYQAEVISLAEKPMESIGEHLGRWEGGHQVTISLDDSSQKVEGVIREDERILDSRGIYFNRIRSRLGSLHFDKPGLYSLSLKPDVLLYEKKYGLKLLAVQLVSE